jgi:pimeloyl-ACP methyl ester carboxylesterase
MNYNVKQTAADTTAIRPFHFRVAEAELTELRRRISATRWPELETVDDDSQGVPLATLRELVRYWQTDYDWRKVEARLNALPQFITEIDGLDIHFIHVRSKHEHALPLIVTHGWPGSVIEQLKIIDPLTNPTAHGGSASDAFDLVIPSMPGYGFSGKPTATGWDPPHIARAWIVLMKRLGYTRFVAQDGDWGSPVSNEMAKLVLPELLGIHVNLPGVVPPEVLKALQCGDPPPTGLSVDEKHAFEQLKLSFAKRRAYALIKGTRPQPLSGLADSPAGLAVAVRSSPGADRKAFRGGHAKPEATAPPRRPACDLPFQRSQSTILALKQVDGPTRVGEGTLAPAVRQGPPSGP